MTALANSVKRTSAQVVELIRAALEEIEGSEIEEPVIRALWSHLSQRRPECLIPLGQAFEESPTEAPPTRPPRERDQ